MGTGIPPRTRSSSTYPRSIVWLRRDLRLNDNAALMEACNASAQVCLAFVVDPDLLQSPRIGAPIVNAFFGALARLREDLRSRASDLAVLCGKPERELPAFAGRIGATAVFYNEDYEPYAIGRDARTEAACRSRGIAVHVSSDHVYFGAGEIERESGVPYRVFTPYLRRWLQAADAAPRDPLPSLNAVRGKLLPRASAGPAGEIPAPERFGFLSRPLTPLSETIAARALSAFASDGGMGSYARDRDYPALDATSHLSPHLRAGTIGIRTCVKRALESGAGKWIEELVWRDYFQMILRRFPYVAERPFVPAGERIAWRRAPRQLRAWQNGETGYPIVDAAMRQLNETGWMHNRLRMIAAGFLVKHLLIDWREGERYFEQRLIDADLAQNNGGWQWCASTGADAMPYFRVFNPIAQSLRYDPDGAFIRRMLPELRELPGRRVHDPCRLSGGVRGYPRPIVDHAFARARALEAYSAAFGRAPQHRIAAESAAIRRRVR